MLVLGIFVFTNVKIRNTLDARCSLMLELWIKTLELKIISNLNIHWHQSQEYHTFL
jgi:hypothetical protein